MLVLVKDGVGWGGAVVTKKQWVEILTCMLGTVRDLYIMVVI